MGKIRVGLVGIGNCSSALVQGVNYYSEKKHKDTIGISAYNLGGYTPDDIEFVSAFDVDKQKVGKDLSEAIFSFPNNTQKVSEVPILNVTVNKGPNLDGIGKYLSKTIIPSDESSINVANKLRADGVEILINFLPVGSTKATHFYANQALEANVAFINAMPVFIASNEIWCAKFENAGLPIAGDDVMSQLGATVLHKTLVKLCVDRGVKINDTYQLNIGGDTDFLNMQEESRLKDKRESKSSAVRAMSPYEVSTRIGPSDYISFLDNDKICYINLKGKYFCGTPLTIDVKLHVIDAFNSAGIMVDAIRGTKIALERNISGSLDSVSAYCFKHPPIQMTYNEAKKALFDFCEGRISR